MSELNLTPTAAKTLQRWHAMLANRDLKALPDLLAGDMTKATKDIHTAP